MAVWSEEKLSAHYPWRSGQKMRLSAQHSWRSGQRLSCSPLVAVWSDNEALCSPFTAVWSEEEALCSPLVAVWSDDEALCSPFMGGLVRRGGSLLTHSWRSGQKRRLSAHLPVAVWSEEETLRSTLVAVWSEERATRETPALQALRPPCRLCGGGRSEPLATETVPASILGSGSRPKTAGGRS